MGKKNKVTDAARKELLDLIAADQKIAMSCIIHVADHHTPTFVIYVLSRMFISGCKKGCDCKANQFMMKWRASLKQTAELLRTDMIELQNEYKNRQVHNG